MTNNELHKGLLEFCDYSYQSESGTWIHPDNNYALTERPPMDANLIRQCHENMTPEQLGEYLVILWADKKHGLANTLIAPLHQQAAAILKAVGKE